jgi:lipoprotein-anchoring transpeptidase ErfK/SrfK
MNKRLCKLILASIFLVIIGDSLFSLAQKTTKPKPTKTLVTETEIAEARTTLAALGYWLDTAATGQDASLRHALIAFQKIAGRPRTGILTTTELAALRIAQKPQPHETGTAHIEVDLMRQVLFVVNDSGAIERILPVSTGSGEWFTEGGRTRQAVTPTGRFKVTHQIKGWRKSPLGLLYYPNYIYNGVAIHGNPAVPATPASHGCIRIPMFAAQAFSEIAKPGTVVLVYDDGARS